jgi:hypothetical protein
MIIAKKIVIYRIRAVLRYSSNCVPTRSNCVSADTFSEHTSGWWAPYGEIVNLSVFPECCSVAYFNGHIHVVLTAIHPARILRSNCAQVLGPKNSDPRTSGERSALACMGNLRGGLKKCCSGNTEDARFIPRGVPTTINFRIHRLPRAGICQVPGAGAWCRRQPVFGRYGTAPGMY